MRVEIEEQHFHLLPERVVFWEEEKVLFCSDLHWGRETYLQKFGMAIPERSFELESKILESALARAGANELWILGDFIHHPEGLHSVLLGQITAWLHALQQKLKLQISFVPGNHDRKYREWTRDLPLRVFPQGIERAGFLFLHDPSKKMPSARYVWLGHLHPALRIEELFGNRKIPCFYLREKVAFLPAFSRLAGGAIVELTRARDRIFAIAEGQVFEWRS